MKLSTKARYGLRALIDLAVHYEKGPVAITGIASRQDISEKYLEQVMLPLKKTGFVRSVRGSQGGFILNKKTDEITVGEIVRALEGPLSIVDCVSESVPAGCSLEDYCVTRNVWARVNEAIADTIDSITLKDLIDDYRDHLEKVEN